MAAGPVRRHRTMQRRRIQRNRARNEADGDLHECAKACWCCCGKLRGKKRHASRSGRSNHRSRYAPVATRTHGWPACDHCSHRFFARMEGSASGNGGGPASGTAGIRGNCEVSRGCRRRSRRDPGRSCRASRGGGSKGGRSCCHGCGDSLLIYCDVDGSRSPLKTKRDCHYRPGSGPLPPRSPGTRDHWPADLQP